MLDRFKRKKDSSIGRNRLDTKDTLPSSSSFSYSSRRSEDNVNLGRGEAIEEGKSKNKKRFLRVELLFGLAIIGIVLYKVIYLEPNVIVKPLMSDQNISSAQIKDYTNTANNYLKSSVLNKNKLTVNVSGLEQKIKSTYPLVLPASLHLSFTSSQPTLYINQSQGVLVIKSLNNSYYSVNLNGKAIDSSDNIASLKTAPGVPILNDESGITLKTNQQALTSTDVDFVLTVQAELQAKGISISSYTLPAASRELDVGIVGQPYIVKFNLENNDPRQQAGTYLATIAQLKSQNITPSNYVDVRVDGRAYYK